MKTANVLNRLEGVGVGPKRTRPLKMILNLLPITAEGLTNPLPPSKTISSNVKNSQESTVANKSLLMAICRGENIFKKTDLRRNVESVS